MVVNSRDDLAISELLDSQVINFAAPYEWTESRIFDEKDRKKDIAMKLRYKYLLKNIPFQWYVSRLFNRCFINSINKFDKLFVSQSTCSTSKMREQNFQFRNYEQNRMVLATCTNYARNSNLKCKWGNNAVSRKWWKLKSLCLTSLVNLNTRE